MRTSTLTLVVPPTRWKVWSTRTRRILFWVSRGMSAISSMNSVPPCASSSAPALRGCSTVGLLDAEQFDSIRSGVIAAALMTTNGPSARPDMVVNRARGQFLAGAGRADDHDAAVGLRRAAR